MAPEVRQTLPQYIGGALQASDRRAVSEHRGDAATWATTSSKELYARAAAVAYELRSRGLAAGDRVALIAQNCTDWIVADFGILFAGCVCVPVFATLALDQVDFILRDSGAKLVFVGTDTDAQRVRAACPQAPDIVAFNGLTTASLPSFEASGHAAHRAEPSRLATFAADMQPDDLAVLIYTSGTTGDPKGVMLSHDNLIWNCQTGFAYAFPNLAAGGAILAILPFAHIYGHTGMIGYLCLGIDYYLTTAETLLADLRAVRPIGMPLVPRIFERVLAGIIARSRAAGGLQAKLVPWALVVGREYMRATTNNQRPSPLLRAKYAAANALVLRKIKPALGLDRVDHLTTGSAALHPDISLTFAGFGVTICEGYGLTETSPVITTSRVVDNRLGTVGKALPGVEIRLAADGEIETRGRHVMKGYYHRNDAPIDAGGWFATGDIGEIDADGYLRLTDRKKELFKTSGGKYVAPARVEMAIKRSIYVAQALVVGDGRPHAAALIAPNWELLRSDFSIGGDVPTAAIAARRDVRDFMRTEVTAQTADLATFEQIRRVALLPRDLTIEAGELSPTLKIKRRVVEARYADLVEAAYAEDLHAAANRS